MASLRTQILRTSFGRYDGSLASGAHANNKLDLEQIQNKRCLRRRVANGVAELVLPHNPQMIVAVPDGANQLGADVAAILRVPAYKLRKDPHTKEFSYLPGVQRAVRTLGRVVLIDDVFNRLTNTNKALALPDMTEHVVVLAGIWDRNPHRTNVPDVPLEVLISEEILEELSDDSPLWSFAA